MRRWGVAGVIVAVGLVAGNGCEPTVRRDNTAPPKTAAPAPVSVRAPTSGRPMAPAPTSQVVPAPTGPWERYVSKHNLFTLLKPAGWRVNETFDQNSGNWSCGISDPAGVWQASVTHGISPTGRDVNALANQVAASMLKAAPSLQLAPAARVQNAGGRRVIVFEGTYSDARRQRRQFRCMVAGGDGSMLCENIEAPEGQLGQAAPLLLQTLANLRVANLFAAGGGAAGPPRPAPMVPQQLASGWAKFSAPQGWRAQDLGRGSCIIADPGQRLHVIVASVEFITPRYAVPGIKGVLVSELQSPHEAFAFACGRQGLASGFRSVFVKPRPDLLQGMRAMAGPLRQVAAEDFGYTCTMKGKPYTGFSCGGCTRDAMGASWRFWHFTILAPSEEFEAALPTLAAVIGSYEINGEMAGRQVASNLANYYAGLRNLSNQIAMNSEQMRRENLQVMINNDRLRDYTSYQTTRMIMGDFHYLAGSSGYVVSNPDGLYTPAGQTISREPYGGNLTQGMQEINSMQLFEQTFRGRAP